jgi:hypothetical protein
MGILKKLLKDKFYYQYIRDRFSPAAQISQRQLWHYYRDCAARGAMPALADCGFRVFSQFEEDGKLLAIFAAIGMGNKTFIEIGADDGINSNCANWYFHHGFYGLFLDGNPESIARGEKFYKKYPVPWDYPPKFTCATVTRENINTLIQSAGLEGTISLLSIDIDGNDYWIWDALEIVSPNVVIIETHNEFGMEDIVVPYDAGYAYPGKHPVYHGASPVAMNNLAKSKGYRLVGGNYYGSNFIFLKNELGDALIPDVTVASVLQHPSVKESQELFVPIKDWEYIRNRRF